MRRREAVEEKQERNWKAQRLGIEEVVIVRGTSLPTSIRARDPARRP